MKALVSLALIATAALFLWNSQRGGDDPLAELQARLDAAEQTYQQAGRAAGVSGADTSAGAERALSEVEEVERALQDLAEASPSAEARERITALLTRAAELRRRMG